MVIMGRRNKGREVKRGIGRDKMEREQKRGVGRDGKGGKGKR